MYQIIKMDLFRLRKTKSTYVFLGLMSVLVLLSSFLFSFSAENMLVDETVNQYGIREGMSQSGIDVFFLSESKASLITDTTTGSNLIFMFPAIFMVLFSGAYNKNNYIRNINGYLPKKYELIISNLVVSMIFSLVFVIIAFSVAHIGYTICSDFYNSLPFGNILEYSKFIFLYFLLLVAVCTVTSFFTLVINNQQASIVLAVLYGSGALINVSTNILKLFFKTLDIEKYAPSYIFYQINLDNINYINNLLISVVAIVITLSLSYVVNTKRNY